MNVPCRDGLDHPSRPRCRRGRARRRRPGAPAGRDCAWRSRTTSTSPASRPPRAARPTPTSRTRPRPVSHASSPPARSSAGKTEPRPVRHRPRGHPQPVRRGREPGRPGLRERRLVERLGRRGGERRGRHRPGHRHRRVGPGAGRVLRRRRAQAHAGLAVDPRAWCRPAARSTACRSSPATWPPRPPAVRSRGRLRPGRPASRPRPPGRRSPAVVPGRRSRVPCSRSGASRRWSPPSPTSRPRPARLRGRRGRPRSPTSTPGDLLYGGALVAERYAAVGAFVDAHPDDVDPIVGAIIAARRPAPRPRPARPTSTGWPSCAAPPTRYGTTVDAVVVPTAPFHPTLADVAADPIGVNAALGRFTNGCNLLGWCAAAVPAGGAPTGCRSASPCSDPAWTDRAVWAAAATRRRPDAPPPTVDDGGRAPRRVRRPPRGPAAQPPAHLARGAGSSPAPRRRPPTAWSRLDTAPPKPGVVRVPDGRRAARGRGLGPRRRRLRRVRRRGAGAARHRHRRARRRRVGQRLPLRGAAPSTGAEDITAHGGWRAWLALSTALAMTGTLEVLDAGQLHHRPGPPGPARVLDGRRPAERARWTTCRSGSPTGPSATRADAAGLECTATGPTLAVRAADASCASAAPTMVADLDGRPVPYWQPFEVEAGQVLRLGRLTGAGLRTYVAVRGGIDVPVVLGSRSTFTLGRLRRPRRAARSRPATCSPSATRSRTSSRRPSPSAVLAGASAGRWRIGVLEGPHAAPEFFTPADIDALFAAEWRVQVHCARTGVRLDGPKPEWARPDGGEAGLHPSNIHDTGYAFGTIDFTGDTPVVLGPDGPSLGGFTCPATVVAAERWKLGQLAPGDAVRFVPIAEGRADDLARRVATITRDAARPPSPEPLLTGRRDPDRRRARRRPADRRSAGVHRPPLGRRVRARRVRRDAPRPRASGPRPRPRRSGWPSTAPAAVVDVTPGIRSLLVQFDPSLVTARRDRRAGGQGRRRAARHRVADDRGAHRAPAAVVGGPRHARGHPPVHGGRARRRPVVPVEPRVHPPGQRPRLGRRRAPHRLRRELPRARPRRRVPRRAGGHAARPAAPAGHHQVQPGPDLDPGERGGHRRRLPLRLRDGGSGRLPVRRPHRSGVVPRRPHPRRRAGGALAATELRPDSGSTR